MTENYNDQQTIAVEVLPQPIKDVHNMSATIQAELLDEQAARARSHLVAVDSAKPGTCIDERARVGLLSGEAVVEPRASVPGGPNIYGLAIAELTGMFGVGQATADKRLHVVTRTLNAAGIMSGGHQKCAANAGFNTWIGFIPQHAAGIKNYARQQLGDSYNDLAMDEVIANATQVAKSGRYHDWAEDDIVHELGPEANTAIEQLVDAPHEGFTIIRNEVNNATIDQSALYADSAIGKGSFSNDEWYADKIENAVTAGPDGEHNATVAKHAREAILAAVATAVPNELLYQIRLKNAV